jgi:hypothetical protein
LEQSWIPLSCTWGTERLRVLANAATHLAFNIVNNRKKPRDFGFFVFFWIANLSKFHLLRTNGT